jgi:hypothetical protein
MTRVSVRAIVARAELLVPVEGLCARAGFATETGVLPPLSFSPRTATVLALRRKVV